MVDIVGSGSRAGMLAKHFTVHRRAPTTENYLAQNVGGAC